MSDEAKSGASPHAELFESIRDLDPKTAVDHLTALSDEAAATALAHLPAGRAVDLLERLPEARRPAVAAAAPFGQGRVWLVGLRYGEGTVGRLMETPPAVFPPEMTIGEVTPRNGAARAPMLFGERAGRPRAE